MTPPELCRTPATVLSAAMRAKRLSPVELVEAVLARIETVNPVINAFLSVDGDRALESARAAEAAVMRGDELGLLHGLPVPIKDLEPSAGLRHTSGSILYTDQIADSDGIVTERVKAAGGIVIGKTNTPHLGHKDMCDNLLGEPGRNPWNPQRTPGGSSGGAAAAVAAGLGPIAHGSDGAGSIRIPAALCGVFGFKPSFGRIPYWPNLDIWVARSHNGPISRTVADAALFTRATAGPDPRDPTTIDNQPEDYVAAVADPLHALRGLRVAWSPDFGYAAVEPEVRRLTEAGSAAPRRVRLPRRGRQSRLGRSPSRRGRLLVCFDGRARGPQLRPASARIRAFTCRDDRKGAANLRRGARTVRAGRAPSSTTRRARFSRNTTCC